MDSTKVNAFLDSAKMVLEQLIQVAPVHGKAELQEVGFKDDHVWIHIGIQGQWSGRVLYGIHHDVALKIISAMMGGMQMTDLDEMGKSAISELGNMISGNASVILSNQGIAIDITPPKLISTGEEFDLTGQALCVPIEMQDVGEIELHMLVAS